MALPKASWPWDGTRSRTEAMAGDAHSTRFTKISKRGCRQGACRGCGSRLVGLLGVVLDAQQRTGPEALVLLDPSLVDLLDRHHVQGVDALPALFLRDDQRRLAEHVDMLHHAEPREVR